MKIYKDKQTELNDIKSTGFSLCLVGGLGLIALILINIGIIPLNLSSSSKITVTISMGLFFIIFLVIGIKSFLSLKSEGEKIDAQFKLEEDILSWFRENYIVEIKKEEYNKDIDSEEPEFYFYSEIISKKLDDISPDLDPAFKEYMIEKIYNIVFPE